MIHIALPRAYVIVMREDDRGACIVCVREEALATEHGLPAPVNSELLQHHAAMCATNRDRETFS